MLISGNFATEVFDSNYPPEYGKDGGSVANKHIGTVG